MKMVFQWISWLSLAALIGVVLLFLMGKTDIVVVKKWMMILTLIWFSSAVVWMWDKKK
jgi:hypothetical protein